MLTFKLAPLEPQRSARVVRNPGCGSAYAPHTHSLYALYQCSCPGQSCLRMFPANRKRFN